MFGFVKKKNKEKKTYIEKVISVLTWGPKTDVMVHTENWSHHQQVRFGLHEETEATKTKSTEELLQLLQITLKLHTSIPRKISGLLKAKGS